MKCHVQELTELYLHYPIRLHGVVLNHRNKFILPCIYQNIPLYENTNKRTSAVLRVTEFQHLPQIALVCESEQTYIHLAFVIIENRTQKLQSSIGSSL
jgi:hypothetical protein